MATTETWVNSQNDSNNHMSTSDVDEEVVVRRKGKINLLSSEDEEDEDEKREEEEQTDSRETHGSEECGVKSGFTKCSDEPTQELSSDCISTAQRQTDSNSDVQTTGIEIPIVEDNTVPKSINCISKSQFDSTTLCSSIAEDVRDEEKAVKIRKKMSILLDSDSEDEKMNLGRSTSPGSDSATQRGDEEIAKPKGKRIRIVNSESDENEEVGEQKETYIRKSVARKPEDTTQKSNGDHNSISMASRMSTLIDSDSEDDNPPTGTIGRSSDEEEPVTHNQTNNTTKEEKPNKNKRSKSIRAAKEEAMREIHSESQRMLRESQVSLPYHRPRQRTLQEFLNRKKDLPALPKTLTAAAKIKMSGKLVGKVLEEKEKEAELFYKSSSDSDNEGGSTVSHRVSIANSKSKRTLLEYNTKNDSTIEETQKIERSDRKGGQGVKEAIQQGDKSLGLPRKLFTGSEEEAVTTQVSSLMETDQTDEITTETRDCNPKRKEFKQGLQDVSMPRKLFGSGCDEPMNIDPERNNADLEDDEKNHSGREIHEANDSQVTTSNKSNNFVEKETIYEPVKNTDVQRNESMEDEMENFELKMSEDPYETTNDKIVSQEAADPKSSTIGFDAITETPFIDNREISKLNGRKEASAGAIIADLAENRSKEIPCDPIRNEDSLFFNSDSSCSNGDSDHGQKPFGHVYGLPLSELDDKGDKSKFRILPEIMKLTPKLQGSPNMLIELSPPKVGVDKLIKRYLNHSVVKKTSESTSEVTAMRTEQTENGLRVVSEILPYKMSGNDKNDDPELSKPGAKLVRLKGELEQQMAILRSKGWEQKELEMKTVEDEDVYRDELSDCGMEDKDDVEEEDEDEKEESSNGEDSELDEDDMPVMEKKDNHKNPFADAEAEVSEAESQDKEGEEDSEEDDPVEADDNNSENDLDKDEELESDEDAASPKNKTWKSKRIIKPFDDEDSDDSETKVTDTIVADPSTAPHFRRTRTDVDMFDTDNNSNDDWLSGGEEDLPVYQQPRDERSQSCATPSVLNNSLTFVSPITQLTALNTGTESVNTESRSDENHMQFLAPLSVKTTPIEVKCYRDCNSEKRDRLQKKLFDDIKDTPNDTKSTSLGFDQFSENTSDDSELAKLMHTARKTSVSDAELLELCSGTFASQTVEIDKLKACSATDKSANELSQKSDTISRMLRIVSSSDEENDTVNSQVENARGKKFKKRVKKLKLSDDEDESDTERGLSDFEEKENGEDEFVDYDSEENEIVVPKKDVQKAAAGFLDEEAELSESEWGSADEDEKGLDKLDWEEGDLDDIDQDQVKKQLEKIHMRQVLDADQREVRLLQEILLEDGELHSDNASRQRKFKWKNIDETENDGEGQLPNIDEEAVLADPNEAECDLEMRKQRLEVEKFLQEQRLKEATEGAEEVAVEDSQLFQRGMRALKKNNKNNKFGSQAIVAEKSETSVTRHTVADLFASPGSGTKTCALQNAIHRGSFLARGEESLARLSVITKQNRDHAIIRPKNSRNFVFAQLSPAIEEAAVESETELDGRINSATDSKFRKRKPPSSLTPASSKKYKK